MANKKQSTKTTNEPKAPKQKRKVFENIKQSVCGVARLAFITATGTAAYILIFSTDSMTLHIVAGVLVVRTAIDALKMSQNV